MGSLASIPASPPASTARPMPPALAVQPCCHGRGTGSRALAPQSSTSAFSPAPAGACAVAGCPRSALRCYGTCKAITSTTCCDFHAATRPTSIPALILGTQSQRAAKWASALSSTPAAPYSMLSPFQQLPSTAPLNAGILAGMVAGILLDLHIVFTSTTN
jgi:hypothetical protein